MSFRYKVNGTAWPGGQHWLLVCSICGERFALSHEPALPFRVPTSPLRMTFAREFCLLAMGQAKEAPWLTSEIKLTTPALAPFNESHRQCFHNVTRVLLKYIHRSVGEEPQGRAERNPQNLGPRDTLQYHLEPGTRARPGYPTSKRLSSRTSILMCCHRGFLRIAHKRGAFGWHFGTSILVIPRVTPPQLPNLFSET